MKQIKVLQIGLSSYPGGVENAIVNYYRFLNADSIHFDFVCTEDKLAYEEEILARGGAIYYIKSAKRNMVQYIRELKSLIENNKYDVVHINLLSAANIVPLIVAKCAKCPKVVIHAHNSYLPSGKIKKILHYINKHFIGLFSSNYMACSRGAAEWLFGKKNIEKTYILKNAIDVEKFQYSEKARTELRDMYNIGDDAVVVGHVGRFAEEKNHKFLVELFFEFHKTVPNSRLLLVGAGNMEKVIKGWIREHQLTEYVIMIGQIEDTSLYYSMMDIFCMPSKFEGLGIVAIEAQVAGLPCVCSEGVPREAVITEKTQRVSLSNQDKWLQSMLDMMKKKREVDTRECVTRAGYDVSCEVQQLEKYYMA